MQPFRNIRRAASVGVTVAVFGTVLSVAALSHRGTPTGAEESKGANFEVQPGTWPMFGGTQDRNMVNKTDANIPDDFAAEEGGENVVWQALLGSKSYGGPTVAAGKVLVGTNNENPRNKRDVDEEGRAIDRGIIMCFDEKSGKFLWQAVHPKLPSGLVHDWPREGICSSPVVEGNRCYYVSNQCQLVCADMNGMADGNQGTDKEEFKTPTDADFIWVLDMMKDLGVFPHNLAVCSPMIVGDVLFVVTSNGVDAEHINVPAPQAPSFIAVDKKTGKVLWKDNSPGREIMHGQWSNPVYAVINGQPQVVFPGGDGWLYGFKPDDGKLLWKFFCNPVESEYELGGRGTRSDFIATPVIYENKVYIGVGQDPEHLDGVGHLWCIDPSKASPEKIDISPAIKEVDGKKVSVLDPKAPENKDSGLVWHFGGPETREGSRREFKFGRTMSTCCIVDGLVYVAELNGYLFCFDARTGKKYWHYDLKSGVWGSPYFVDGKVFIGNEDGDLFVFRHVKDQEEGLDEDDYPDRDKKKEVREKLEKKVFIRRILVDEPIRSTPVAAHGKLFVMTERSLFCVGNKE